MPRPAVDSDRTLALLAQIFPQLAAEALQKLGDSAHAVEYPAQVTLCHEGEMERRFYIIVSGAVEVFKITEGQRLLINRLGAGAHFGDLALLLDLPRTATIITAEPTQVLEIDRDTFSALLKSRPEIVVALTQMVLKRFLAQEEKQLTEIARLKKRDVPPPKVFISYARVDGAFATRLANSLLKHQIDVWFDTYRLDPGVSWARQIGEALDQCQILLLIASPTSLSSENVDDEWNYYLDQKKPVVTVLHQPCKLPYRLSKLHYINFHDTDYDQAVARVVATLNTQP
jgi:CRP-like cAMP-binding protein